MFPQNKQSNIQGGGGGGINLQGGSAKKVQNPSLIPVQSAPFTGNLIGVNGLNQPAAPAPAPAPAVYAPSAAELAARAQQAKIANLRGGIRGYQGEVDSIYNQLFGDLDTLIRSRAEEIDRTAGENINKLTDKYTGSIPGIESSYAALGAGDSTDNTYAKVDAKKGYESSVEEVGKQKAKDQATLGEYDQTTRANWGADRDALSRIFSRLDETENEQDLVQTRNDVENKLGTAKASRASLMTDQGLQGKIKGATDSASRIGSIQGSLDNILQSALSGAVKDAAVAAVGQSAGLTDEEKNQIKANSGY